jgi:hypothetical protein
LSDEQQEARDLEPGTITGSSAEEILEGLDVDRDKQQAGKGAPGSRENPEIHENVPGHVIPILADEFDDFGANAGRFLAGDEGEDTFIPSASNRASTASASPACR